MTLRVVLYAEGAGEMRGALVSSAPSAPGRPIPDERLGPAHLLTARCMSHVGRMPQRAIEFLEPLRVRGRMPRGSDLLSRQTLRQLLTFVAWRPDLAIVFVDCDGQPSRTRLMQKHLEGIGTPHLLAVAVQEFESWLLAGRETVARASGTSVADPGPVEDLAPREARELLARSIAGCGRTPKQVRQAIAAELDIELVRRRCRAFDEFVRELGAAVGA